MKIEAYLCAIGCLIMMALTYSVAAFITWDINPGNWSTSARFVAFSCWMFGFALAVSTTGDLMRRKYG